MGWSHIRLSRDGPCTTITLNRPKRRNALSLDLLGEVLKALREVPDEARSVVIGAEGPAFSSGHDIAEMVDRPVAFFEELFGVCTDVMTAIQAIPQPVIAKVHGVATAAGCQLVASCDLAIASSEAWFGTPGIKIGLFCTTPAVPLVRTIGPKRALDMLLTARPIDAETALAWGLVNRIVPPEDLDAAVLEYVEGIAVSSRHVIALGKQTFYRQAALPLSDAYAVAQRAMAANAAGEQAQEGMAAFVEKRPPIWPE